MKWLGLGLTVGALGGCLIPQDEEYLSELPVRLNHPLRIVEQHAKPSNRIIRGFGTPELCELEFSVPVEDLDLADTLVAYWFVDYDPNQPRGADSVVNILPDKGAIDAVRDEFAVFRARYNSADIGRLNTPGDHVVEVVVTDTALLAGREPQGKSSINLEDGTVYEDRGYTASYAWFVKTEAGGTGVNCQ
ncbi:hypothetical protein JQX13_43350 [Archangium violaceum]|uniref:hypothetical protein n=1 Tax=Archangium violaceum TaxID=83451 RepID=UPI00193AF5CC|nr:hypothetical protein [Archangium violaceum]QRK06831.1 hypothetical protein JQX13_43350 [Archangium violaceum]